MHDLDTKNYKTLLSDIKEQLNKWRDVSCSGYKDPILLICNFFPSWNIQLFQWVLAGFNFCTIWQMYSKINLPLQMALDCQNNFKVKNSVGGWTLSYFKTQSYNNEEWVIGIKLDKINGILSRKWQQHMQRTCFQQICK